MRAWVAGLRVPHSNHKSHNVSTQLAESATLCYSTVTAVVWRFGDECSAPACLPDDAPQHRDMPRVGALSVRKWNRNLSPTENMRASFKQPVVRLNTYSAIAWSLLWILASFLAAIDLDQRTVLTYFLAGPAIAFLALTFGTYLGLPHTAFGRTVVELEAESAAVGGFQAGVGLVAFAGRLR